MKVIDVVGAFFAGLISIAALSLILAPKSTTAAVVNALGSSTANLITAAKNYPGGQ